MSDPSSRPPVVVTGGAGYIGSVTVGRLLAAGRSVRVLDSMLFGDGALEALRAHPALAVARGDIRDAAAVAQALEGADAVLHLAGLVGDPACALDPSLTREVNVTATGILSRAACAAGLRRVVYASTCSVYGAAGDSWLAETSATAPISLYAESNLESENLLRAGLAGSGVELSILRFATVFGVSPRMRVDLVVNLLTARASRERAVEVHGGEQWRPHVHVDDVATALLLALDHPHAAGAVLNVGSDALNLRIAALAEKIANRFPGTALSVSPTKDPRSYRVSFRRIAETLGFEARHSLDSGIAEIADYLNHGQDVDWRATRYSNVRTLEASR